jgi:hypothetical protein
LLDGLPRFADRLGEGFFLFIIMPPLTAVVQFDKVSQCPAGGEQLPFGVLALDFRGRAFGHGPNSADEM